MHTCTCVRTCTHTHMHMFMHACMQTHAYAQITGGRSVPRVFIGGKFIGGGDDTVSLSRTGLEKRVTWCASDHSIALITEGTVNCSAYARISCLRWTSCPVMVCFVPEANSFSCALTCVSTKRNLLFPVSPGNEGFLGRAEAAALSAGSVLMRQLMQQGMHAA